MAIFKRTIFDHGTFRSFSVLLSLSWARFANYSKMDTDPNVEVGPPAKENIDEQLERIIHGVLLGAIGFENKVLTEQDCEYLMHEMIRLKDIMPPKIRLSIVDCDLGHEHCKHLAQILTHCNVSCLWISKGNIGDDGCDAICQALIVNESVEEVALNYHGIGPRGAKALAAVLRSNHSIKELWINGNPIENDGAVEIMKTLEEENRTLLKLHMYDIEMKHDVCVALSNVIVKNFALEYVAVESASDPLDEEMVERAMDANPRIYITNFCATSARRSQIKKQLEILRSIDVDALMSNGLPRETEKEIWRACCLVARFLY